MQETMMKTYRGWADAKVSLGKYLKVGDVVDYAMYDYFLCVLPPAYYSNVMVQVGEPYTHVKDIPAYMTLVKNQNGWVYAGVCYEGSTDNLVEKTH